MNAPVESPLLGMALTYAARGWPVFPCSPSQEKGVSKRPLTPKETQPGAKDGGLYLATTDGAQIREWWRRWPKALIGLPTGARSGIVVLDLDPETFPADTMLRAVTDFCGGVLPPCPVVRTQSGGLHLWFAYPDLTESEKLGNRAALFKHVDGIDEAIREHVDIRGEGGYVIVPPSVMVDGLAYAWEAEPDDEPPPALPPRLLDVILRRGEFSRDRQRERVPAPPPSPGDLADDSVRRYAIAAMDKEIQEVARAGSGQRNHALNRAAFALAQLVAAGVLTESVVRASLEDAANRSGLVKDDGWKSVRDTIQSGFQAGLMQPRDLTDVAAKARERAERFGSKQGARLAPPRSEARPAAPPSQEPEGTFDDGGASGDRFDEDGDAGPSDADATGVDPEVLERCAALDHSDTDNGRRLIAHFGQDLCVMEQEGARNLDFLAWTGTHWDIVSGNDAALRVAQKIGGRIALEADFLTFLPHEKRLLADAERAAVELAAMETRRSEWNDADKAKVRDLERSISAGKEARAALDKRKKARRQFAVSSKNKARLEAMLACAAPHLTRRPDAFNADPMLVATKAHTLRFVRMVDDENANSDEPRMTGRVEVIEGHRREDYITHIVPVIYDPQATCPKWTAFLEEFLPVESVRRCVQVFSGLGLLGLPIQKLLFHYGLGANGKSVFMEVLMRLFGPLAVGLPSESIVGSSERSGAGASPDLARLYGRRVVRVLELPADKPVQEDLVKKLTGGEKIPVRSLFKGFFEFQPVFKAHMSGNGFPRIDGTDNGIWRRIAVIHWPVTLEESRQGNFEDVVSGFADEQSGILNWLVEGAITYLREGLVLPDEVRAATQEYRDEMDPIGQFAADCVEKAPGENVPARVMYDSYVSWCIANAKKPVFETKFGRVMKTKFARDDKSRIRQYVDCRLHDVPPRPDAQPRSPYDD